MNKEIQPIDRQQHLIDHKARHNVNLIKSLFIQIDSRLGGELSLSQESLEDLIDHLSSQYGTYKPPYTIEGLKGLMNNVFATIVGN